MRSRSERSAAVGGHDRFVAAARGAGVRTEALRNEAAASAGWWWSRAVIVREGHAGPGGGAGGAVKRV